MQDLTLKETAKILRFSYQHLINLVNRGEFPAYKVGGRWRVNPMVLEQVRNGNYTSPPKQAKERGKSQWQSKNAESITMSDLNLREKKYTAALVPRPKVKHLNLKLI